MIPDFWTVDKETMLRRCVEMNLSGAAASVLVGCSRNAAIAKADRMGIPFAKKPDGNQTIHATPEQVRIVSQRLCR